MSTDPTPSTGIGKLDDILHIAVKCVSALVLLGIFQTADADAVTKILGAVAVIAANVCLLMNRWKHQRQLAGVGVASTPKAPSVPLPFLLLATLGLWALGGPAQAQAQGYLLPFRANHEQRLKQLEQQLQQQLQRPAPAPIVVPSPQPIIIQTPTPTPAPAPIAAAPQMPGAQISFPIAGQPGTLIHFPISGQPQLSLPIPGKPQLQLPVGPAPGQTGPQISPPIAPVPGQPLIPFPIAPAPGTPAPISGPIAPVPGTPVAPAPAPAPAPIAPQVPLPVAPPATPVPAPAAPAPAVPPGGPVPFARAYALYR